MRYDATLNYEETNEVFCDGVKYRCLKENGPGTSTVRPGSDPETWRNVDQNVPAGAVMPFHNVRLGGSDGRRPIFWGANNADEGWILCDGGTDGQGGNTPDLVDRFIRGGAVESNGTTGGKDSEQVPVKLSLSTKEAVLSLDQMPNHNHNASGQTQTTTAGEHTHTRGTMNITGTHYGTDAYQSDATGCFYLVGPNNHIGSGDSDMDNLLVGFDAARSWTGETSKAGSHSHRIDLAISSQGGGKGHSHQVEIDSKLPVDRLPSFYALAYFVKAPST